jgi:hypothetical protein
MNKQMRFLLTASLVFMNIALAYGQGLYWESQMSLPQGNMQQVLTQSYYRSKMFKQTSEYGSMIFRLDREKMYMIDNQKKEYTELTFKQLEEITKKANIVMEQKLSELKEQMKGMQPEQQKAMQKALDEQGIGNKSRISVTKTGESKKICGYSCVKYVLRQNNKDVGTVWTTSNVKDYEKMKGEMKKVRERVMAQIPNGIQIADAMQKINGFPMETSISGTTTVVSKVEKKSIPESEFEVPAGYKKVDPQMMGK